jgi:hypothetical protein
MAKGIKKKLSSEQTKQLLAVLKARFEKSKNRHKDLEWVKVESRLCANPEKLWSLNEMENTGGEPDVVEHDKKTGEYTFYDCSAESPNGRRSICYDGEALASRKENKPANSAMNMAAAMGIELFTEEKYRALQQLIKLSNWAKNIALLERPRLFLLTAHVSPVLSTPKPLKTSWLRSRRLNSSSLIT